MGRRDARKWERQGDETEKKGRCVKKIRDREECERVWGYRSRNMGGRERGGLTG